MVEENRRITSRAFVLIIFLSAVIPFLLNFNEYFILLGVLQVALAVILSFYCGWPDPELIFVLLSSGCPVFLGLSILAIESTEMPKYHWGYGLCCNTIFIGLVAFIAFILLWLNAKKYPWLDWLGLGLLYIGFMYVIPFSVDYAPNVLNGSYLIPTQSGMREDFGLGYALLMTVIYDLLFIITLVMLLISKALKWRAKRIRARMQFFIGPPGRR